MSKLITPTPHQRIPASACRYYKCCRNCEHFYYDGVFPHGTCAKVDKRTDATRHCKKFEERG